MPLDAPLQHLPAVRLGETLERAVRNGNPIRMEHWKRPLQEGTVARIYLGQAFCGHRPGAGGTHPLPLHAPARRLPPLDDKRGRNIRDEMLYAQGGRERTRPVALGTFDGVHLGHQTVLEVAQTIALCEGMTPCALSFCSTRSSVVGAGAPPLLTLPAEKALLAARSGLEEMALLPFTRDFAALPARDFARLLVEKYRARHVVVGENYTFGAGGAGDVDLLDRLSKALGFVLHVVPKVRVSGMDVSSTAIRSLLAAGDVRRAAALLGRAYSIGGPIVHGRRIGHRMGFPTVNVALPKGKLCPSTACTSAMSTSRARAAGPCSTWA